MTPTDDSHDLTPPITYAACESSVGDVLVANFHPVGSDGRSRPLWLNRGALHRGAATAVAGGWYECRDLNPGSGVGNAR